MSNKNKGFERFVIIFVTLIGGGFGSLTGLSYYESYWWVGLMVGAVSSYPLAKLYLKQLTRISLRGYSRKVIWLSGTFVATICGIICTTLVHGVMILVVVCCSDMSLRQSTDGLWSIVLMVGEIIGACVGFIAGGICSLRYVLSVMDKANETA